jgi:hypothetical protein
MIHFKATQGTEFLRLHATNDTIGVSVQHKQDPGCRVVISVPIADLLEWVRQHDSEPLDGVQQARRIDQLLVMHRADCRSAVVAGWNDGWGRGYAQAHREANGKVKAKNLEERKEGAASDMGFDNADDLEAFLHNRGLRIVEGDK